MKELGQKLQNAKEKTLRGAKVLGGSSLATAVGLHVAQGNPYVEVGLPTAGFVMGEGLDYAINNPGARRLSPEHARDVSWVVRGFSITAAALTWRLMGPNEITNFFTGLAAGSLGPIRHGIREGRTIYRRRRIRK